MDAKKIAAEKAVEYIEKGMTVGLGTGTTAYWAIQKIGEKIKQGLQIKAVASSQQTEDLAKQVNIPIVSFSEIKTIDIAIDGADEVDENKNLIKGGGGALLREKIIAYNSQKFLVIVDSSKLVEVLGKFPLPVEIVPFAVPLTLRKLESFGCKALIRQRDGNDFISDNKNLIADCHFEKIPHPEKLNEQLHSIPGVVETGLFSHQKVHSVIAGYANGTVKVL